MAYERSVYNPDVWELTPPLTTNDIASIIGRAIIEANEGPQKPSCHDCIHIENAAETYEAAWYICEEKPHCSNLKNFPFKTAPKCLEINIWSTAFHIAPCMAEYGFNKYQVKAMLKIWLCTNHIGIFKNLSEHNKTRCIQAWKNKRGAKND